MNTVVLTIVVLALVGGALLYMFPKLRYRVLDVKDSIDAKLADPVKDHGHKINEAKAKLVQAKKEMVEAIAANKQLVQKAKAAGREIAKYINLAENAAKAQDAESVSKFIKEKQRAEAREKSFLTQIDANDHIISQVKVQLADRNDQIENAEANKEILEAQLSGTKLRQDIARTGSDLGDDLGDLGTLQNHVDQEVARAEAYEEVNGKSDADLEAKYAQEGNSVEDEAAQLLAKHSN